eukprot:gnl/Chilomastix_cuspidata/419.p1 GENE.gnl/Chilomastix_cuspidata/419~~gnl/Chilomastix_cuspidata/419.p1  ORF type:complete len:676 (+),score=145.20 gnl/Chilomastix_cuspidata/419:227-2029(+)
MVPHRPDSIHDGDDAAEFISKEILSTFNETTTLVIAGFCAGGVFATLLHKKLTDQNANVFRKLFILDSLMPESSAPRAMDHVQGAYIYFATNFNDVSMDDIEPYVSPDHPMFHSLSVEERVEEVHRVTGVSIPELIESSGSGPDFERFKWVTYINENSKRQKLSPEAELTFYTAQEAVPGIELPKNISAPFQDMAANFTEKPIPGNHFSMLSLENSKPVAGDLLLALRAAAKSQERKRFIADSLVPLEIDDSLPPVPSEHAGAVILLTGASGFLGSHILAHLLAATEATVHCVVRAASKAKADEKIRAALVSYGLLDAIQSQLSARVIAHCGDVTKPGLGLAGASLEKKVDTVIHAAGVLHGDYETNKRVNAQGTLNAIRFCASSRTKHLIYISSTNSLVKGSAPQPNRVHDSPELLGADHFVSKWLAERLVERAAHVGLPATIIRPSYLAASTNTGIFPTGSSILPLFAQACAQMRMVPDSGFFIGSTHMPVDRVATFAASQLRAAPGFQIHTLAGPVLTAAAFAETLGALGAPARVVPFDRWLAQVKADGARNPLLPFHAFFAGGPEPEPLLDEGNSTPLPFGLGGDYLRRFFGPMVR